MAFDFQKRDAKGRNLLHLAINHSSGGLAQTFDFEKILIDNKIDYNAVDNK